MKIEDKMSTHKMFKVVVSRGDGGRFLSLWINYATSGLVLSGRAGFITLRPSGCIHIVGETWKPRPHIAHTIHVHLYTCDCSSLELWRSECDGGMCENRYCTVVLFQVSGKENKLDDKLPFLVNADSREAVALHKIEALFWADSLSTQTVSSVL